MQKAEIFAERYLPVRRLGKGGMGEVWLAQDTLKGNMPVALKFVCSELANDTRAINNLSREVINAQKLTHTNILRVYELMKYKNTCFITMEYVVGEDLNARLGRYQQQSQNFSLEEVLKCARQICLALDYAHDQKVLHLDIKPSNIICDERGNYKLMDFGIARSAHDSMTRITRALQYTPGYASPEQIEGQMLTRRTDIYCLAATFYDLLAGKVPCPTDYATINVTPQPITGVDDHINQTLLLGLSKNPDHRPQTTMELLNMLVNPSTATPKPKSIYTPAITGKTISQANAVVPSQNIKITITSQEFNNQAEEGTIIRQTPDAGAVLKPGDEIKVVLSKGPELIPPHTRVAPITFPAYDEEQLPRRRKSIFPLVLICTVSIIVLVAVAYFLGLLKLEPESSNHNTESGLTDVHAPIPPPTANTTTVPDMQDKTLAEATKLLSDKGLKYITEPSYKLGIGFGNVINSDPPTEQKIEVGSTITLRICDPNEATVPNIIGLKKEGVKKSLKDAGYSSGKIDNNYNDDIAQGLVIKQDPPAGSKAPVNSRVNYTLSKGKKPELLARLYYFTMTS